MMSTTFGRRASPDCAKIGAVATAAAMAAASRMMRCMRASASRLFESNELYYCSRWLLGENQGVSGHAEVVLISGATDREFALGDHGLRGKTVSGHRIRAAIEVQRVEHRDLVGVGRLVVRRIVRQRPRPLDPRKAVMLPREHVQTRLRIGNWLPVGVGELSRSEERRVG